MDFSKLEQLEKHIHIVSAIEKAASFGGDIWQSDLSDARHIFQIKSLHVDVASAKIVIQTGSENFVQSGLPIFIRLRYRNIIFRVNSNEFMVNGAELICLIPTDVKALASRTTERYVLPVELDISLSIKRFARSIKEMTPELEVRVIDVSESGIGILISGANREYFRPYDHFWIKAVDNKALNKEIFGTILYVAPKGYYLKKSDVRVGLSLSTPLSWDTFSDLKKKCKVVLSA